MVKIWNSEEISKKYFADLGYKILEKDKEGTKKGCDFFIEKNGIIQSVEAKTKMGNWVQLLQPQLDRLEKGGLLAIVSKDNTITIITKNDIKKIEPANVFKVYY